MCLLFLHPPAHSAEEWVYTVKAGDTLWALTKRYLTDLSLWPELQRMNGVAEPRRMPVGIKLRMPLAWMKAGPATAHFGAVEGEVEVERVSRGAPRKAIGGDALHAGDIVRTRASGRAAVEFHDGSTVTLHPDSILRLDVMRAYAAGLSEVRTGLSPGRAEARVQAQPEQPSRFEIDTPAGITSVRGTDFRVSVPADERTSRTEVLDGKVAVVAAGKEVAVPAGYGTVMRVGEAPGAPIALLPPPDLDALPASVPRLPADIVFPAVTGAVGYRTQLARGDAFEQVMFEAVSDTPQLRLPELPNGRYVVRVRAIDVAQLEGGHAQRPLEIAVRPSPPALIAPENGAQIAAAPVQFRWGAGTSGVTYRLQLARTPRFDPLEVDAANLTVPEFMLEAPLAPGAYFWRVAAATPADGEGEFSAAHALRRLPLTPLLLAPAVDANGVELRWEAGPAGDRYDAQLARDEGFLDVLASASVIQEARLRIPRPAGARYYARVRAVDAEGFASPYSPAQVVDISSAPSPTPRLTAPDLAPAEVFSDRIVFRWHGQQPSRQYQLQLAKDDEFRNLVVDRRVSATELSVARPPAGRYFARVRAEDSVGMAGPFSASQTVEISTYAPSWLLPFWPFLFFR